MKKLKFYDLKTKKSFQTDEYDIQTKSGRTFAVACTPSGGKVYRVMKKEGGD